MPLCGTSIPPAADILILNAVFNRRVLKMNDLFGLGPLVLVFQPVSRLIVSGPESLLQLRLKRMGEEK